MSWRVADSLNVLLAEVDQAAPGRNKASDGSIGDAAHASRSSDHNPWVIDANGVGVVRARDITDDPARMRAAELAIQIAALLGKHPALGSGAMVIWNRRIISTDRLSEGWRPYTGSNPHDKHVHVSVGTRGYDSTAPWGVLNQEDDMADKVTQDQLDRIEKGVKQAVNKLNNNVDRLKKVNDALEKLATDVSDDATRAQVRRVLDILQEDEA